MQGGKTEGGMEGGREGGREGACLSDVRDMVHLPEHDERVEDLQAFRKGCHKSTLAHVQSGRDGNGHVLEHQNIHFLVLGLNVKNKAEEREYWF